MSFAFNDQQRKTLELICEAFNPSLSPMIEGDHQAIFENHAGLYPIIEHLEKALGKSRKINKDRLRFFFRQSISHLFAGI